MVGGLHRGELVDHPDAPELGFVVPGPRLLSPLRQPRRRREALRHRRAVRAPSGSTSSRRCSARMLESAQEAFEVLISIGAGTGLLYLLRWFWWRINAWCEVVAMVSSFTISVVFFVMRKNGPRAAVRAHACSIRSRSRRSAGSITAFVSAADQPRAADRVLPEGASVGPWLGDGSPRGRASATPRPRCYSDDMGKATLGWIAGCLTIWSSLFAIGNFLYGRTARCAHADRRLRRQRGRACCT